MKISGTLTLKTPMMIAVPGDFRVDANGNPTRQQDGFRCSHVATMRVPATATFPAWLEVPVVPANTLRGLLRRAGADLVENALIRSGEKLTLGAYHALRCGTPYGHPDKAPPTISEIQQAMTVPPLALFGGGPRMIHGALRADTCFPIVRGLLDRGIVSEAHMPSALADGAEGRPPTLLATGWLRRADDALDFSDHTQAAEVVASYNEAISQWQELIGEARSQRSDNAKDAKELAKARDEAKAAAEEAGEKFDGSKFRKDGNDKTLRGVKALNAIQYVTPGTPFAFALDIDSEHPATLGFALMALAGFANRQSLGGFGRLGFGRFALDVSGHDQGEDLPVLVRSGDRYDVDRRHPKMAEAIAAADAWLDTVTAGDLEALLLPSSSSAESVRKTFKDNEAMLAAFDAVFGYTAPESNADSGKDKPSKAKKARKKAKGGS